MGSLQSNLSLFSLRDMILGQLGAAQTSGSKRQRYESRSWNQLGRRLWSDCGSPPTVEPCRDSGAFASTTTWRLNHRSHGVSWRGGVTRDTSLHSTCGVSALLPCQTPAYTTRGQGSCDDTAPAGRNAEAWLLGWQSAEPFHECWWSAARAG